ncbi:unnamed protein product [Gadus morhua 'NCC']
MSSGKPYIGCKLGLISKAQNRYEGILFTIDTINSTVVLEKVKCFGTEGRPTHKPIPPKHDIFEFITFRGSDIKDIKLCEPPRSHHSLPHDPAIIQSSDGISSGIYNPQEGPFSPLRMPSYNQLASSCLLNQQLAAVHGFGQVPGQLVRRAPMVEKAVQTSDGWRPQGARPMPPRDTRDTRPPRRNPTPVSRHQEQPYRGQSGYFETGPPPRRGQGRRRNQGRGWEMAEFVASSTLKFDTDFDFDSANAQFIKMMLEREMQDWLNRKEGKEKAEHDSPTDKNLEDPIGPKCYYDKGKSFYDKLSSDNDLSPGQRSAGGTSRHLEFHVCSPGDEDSEVDTVGQGNRCFNIAEAGTNCYKIQCQSGNV